jgi:hypothetical protein
MKNLKRNYSESGQGLVIVIILLVLLIGGWVWLRSNKATMDREARDFGRQVIESLSVRHDISVFRDHLSPQGRLDYPPSRQPDVIGLHPTGHANQPIKIEENVTFESGFSHHEVFSRRGCSIQLARRCFR